jgi:3-keto-disaccharide hydrolase
MMTLRRLLIVAALVSLAAAPQPTGWKSLWNGKNLDGWTTWMQAPSPTSDVPGLKRDADGKYLEAIGSGRDPLNVFTVAQDVDGRSAIRISGEAFGELRTKASFSNYHLKFQFKWGEKKWPPRDRADTRRDSGLLYHVHAEPGAEGRTWARSVELQIQEGDVGDLYAVGSAIAVRSTVRRGTNPAVYDYDPKGEWFFFSQSHGSSGRCVKQPDNEKPTGEWNTVELVAFGKDSIHIVNGKVVMRLHDPLRIDTDLPTSVTSGPIILQSEGAEVFYRDIQVRSIKSVPAEYAEKAEQK